MVSYKLSKTKKKKKTNRKIKSSGMKFSFHLRPRPNFIDVKEIYIYEPTLKKNVLEAQFNHVFKRLLSLVMYLDETSDTGDCEIALNEILKTRQILKDKYSKEIDAKTYRNYLKKVSFLEQEIRQKLALQESLEKQLDYEERKGRGR